MNQTKQSSSRATALSNVVVVVVVAELMLMLMLKLTLMSMLALVRWFNRGNLWKKQLNKRSIALFRRSDCAIDRLETLGRRVVQIWVRQRLRALQCAHWFTSHVPSHLLEAIVLDCSQSKCMELEHRAKLASYIAIPIGLCGSNCAKSLRERGPKTQRKYTYIHKYIHIFADWSGWLYQSLFVRSCAIWCPIQVNFARFVDSKRPNQSTANASAARTVRLIA